MRQLLLALTLPLLAVAACSSSATGASGSGDGGPGGGADGDGILGCPSGGIPFDTYTPNMSKPGKNGIYTFVLASADPAPPAEPMNNTWTVKVLDSSSKPVTGATMSLPTNVDLWKFAYDPYMPKHGHGTSVPPTVTNNGDGTVTLKMYFFMPGVWQVFVQATDGATVDGAMFAFCMP
jgi:hypothetical protein